MKLGMIQIRVGDDPAANLNQALEGLEQCARQGADLVVLPELWNTPFDNDSIRAHAHEWDVYLPPLQKAARLHHMWIVAGSLPALETGEDGAAHLYNRAAILNAQGEIIACCDKNHLLEVHTARHTYKESDVFTPGSSLCTVKTPWGVMGVCICYDLRFPELARLLCQDAFLLVVPAGFNAKVGAKHWLPLLQTRAMENEVFAAGVNPQAAQYSNYASYGHSALIHPDGGVLTIMEDAQLWSVVEIDPQHVETIRRRSPFWNLRRTDLYDLKETQHEKNPL